MSNVEYTCQSVMTEQPVTIHRSETLQKALQLLLQHKLLALPVVDDDGRFFGMFLRSQLVALLLPRIVQMETKIPEIARLLEVGFLTDTIEDTQNRFRSFASKPVGDYTQTDSPRLRPDTPIINAVLLLYRTRTYLPVVDEATGRLLGVVSTWDVLARIAGDKA